MDKFEVCAGVLADALVRDNLNLADYCDIYSPVGEAALEILRRYASIEKKALNVRATSKLGAPLRSPLGAFVQAMEIRVTINDGGRAISSGMAKPDLIEALKREDKSR